MAYAAFSAIVLLAIGRGAASTKYATLSSLGNLPVVYMTASDGWVHDRFGTAWMLHSEALIAIVCIVLATRCSSLDQSAEASERLISFFLD